MLTAVASPPTGALFDVVLVIHVAAVLVGLGTVAATGAAAARVLLARGAGAPPSAGLVRYFAPGANWSGRTLYAVPLLGLVLVALSRGAFRFDDGWVLVGWGLWLAAVALAEGVLWPAERRLQGLLGGREPVGAAAGEGPGNEAVVDVAGLCRRACWSSAVIVAVLVAAMVVMTAKP